MSKIDFTRWEVWMHGLAAASISAAATTGGAVLGSYIGQVKIDWHQLEVSVGVSSLIAACMYLKSSPLPVDVTVQTLTFTPDSTTVTTIKPSDKSS